MTIEGAPGEKVEIWYRGDRATGEAPLVYSGKLGRTGRVTLKVPRAYLVIGKPGRRSGTPLDLQREGSSSHTLQMPKAK